MSGVEQSVLYMKVTEALRSVSPNNIAELAKTYNIADFPNLLTLAVEMSPYETVAWVIKLYRAKDRNVNETDPKSGNTPLHIAVIDNRPSVVKDLMAIPSLDDTIRNKEGLTALDLASDLEMEHAIQHAENRYAEEMSVSLKSAFKDRNLTALEQIYANPRVSQLLNINGIDPDTGYTVLHDSARINDVNLVRFILAHGGDPMVKDRQHHKLPQDLTTDNEIRTLLNTSAKSRAIMDRTSADRSTNPAERSAPVMEGYLKKWTNLTSGYKLRYFHLQDGKLSYYKRPEDLKRHRSERGSINLRRANVRLDSSEKNKFEISDENRNRYFLKATHPADTNKWVWVLKEAITYCRDVEKGRAARQGSGKASRSALRPLDTQTNDHSASRPTSPTNSASVASPRTTPRLDSAEFTASPRSTPSTENFSPSTAAAGVGQRRADSLRSVSSSQLASPMDTARSADAAHGHRRKVSLANSSNDLFVNDLASKDDADSDIDMDDDMDYVALRGPQISAESIIARLSALKDLMTMLVAHVRDETLRDAIPTAQGSLDVLSSDIVMMQRQFRAHLQQMTQKFEYSEKSQRAWASTYRDLEIQYEKLEGQTHIIRKQLGNNDSDDDDEFFDTFDNAPTKPEASSGGGLASNVANGVSGLVSSAAAKVGLASSADNSGQSSLADTTNLESVKEEEAPTQGNSQTVSANGPVDSHAAEANSITKAPKSSSARESTNQSAVAVPPMDKDSKGQSESQDTSATSEIATTNKSSSNESTAAGSTDRSPTQQGLTKPQAAMEEKILQEKSFAGYNRPPRTKLKIDADNRPKLSLWGILKNLIGKDMTKMTLPVTFNECTSLLQRSAEDMEYVSLLDRAAAATDDPGLRMAYVAAFAGSSYSSTINRVAKPFNPLLGETYEYARPDQGYRMFAEQVSHHPPIGALMAESKNWDFYGESNVESKFYGRSFDINPLGLWYLNLRPNQGSAFEEELYSFRKLTSSVVGIMIGNPVVDNYGDMKITNHTSGVQATVNYKARGWRGSSAYKLHGKITDKQGKELWSIAGQWNDKIWGMKHGSTEKVLLWEAHPRHKTPFNLTDFAITLNDINSDLEPWLPPTDTRLRPDQRAMEEGRYDDASDLKNKVEEKQRAARRQREAEGREYKPQWFVLKKHPVTGLDYYEPINHYWQQRADKKLADKGDIF